MKKQIDSKNLAYYILAKAGAMNHLKLQKLLYYINAWHLVFFDMPIINDTFEAWVHGPVSRKIWETFKEHSKIYTDLRLKSDFRDKHISSVEGYLDSEQLELVHDVLEEYGDKSSYYLETLTHSELPWQEARKFHYPGQKSDNIINHDIIKKYYSSKL